MRERKRCDICGGEGRLWLQRGNRQLLRCTACGFAWVPQGLLLTTDGVSIYEDESGALFEQQADYYYDESAVDAAEDKLEWVSAFAPAGGSLLDAGANVGLFVREARRRYQAVGIEPSPVAVRIAAEHTPGVVTQGSIYEEHPSFVRRFDVVTLFDVIEHLDDPRGAVTQCRRFLKPGGWVVLTTPDSGSAAARLLGSRWHHLDLDQHVSIFSISTLSRLLLEEGFLVDAVRTFGRRYRASYIARRLRELGRGNVIMRAGAVIASPLSLMPNVRIPINLRDVVGVVARMTGDRIT